MIRRSLLWFVCAMVITSIAWGAATSLAGAVLFGRWADLGSHALQAAMWAAMLTPLVGPPYALVLFAWPKLLAFFPAAEHRLGFLALAAVILVLPTAVIVGWSFVPRFPFWLVFPCALAAGWLGVFLPRVVVSTLRPGAFAPSSNGPLSLRAS